MSLMNIFLQEVLHAFLYACIFAYLLYAHVHLQQTNAAHIHYSYHAQSQWETTNYWDHQICKAAKVTQYLWFVHFIKLYK